MIFKGYQFWKSLYKVRYLFNRGVALQIGDGRATSFWKDVWLGNCALKISFAKLFNIFSNTDVSVVDSLKNKEWKINFCR